MKDYKKAVAQVEAVMSMVAEQLENLNRLRRAMLHQARSGGNIDQQIWSLETQIMDIGEPRNGDWLASTRLNSLLDEHRRLKRKRDDMSAIEQMEVACDS